MATKVTLEALIELAYKAKSFEISGGPGWIRSDRYDVVAKAEEPDSGPEQLLLMLQTLLEDRFKHASSSDVLGAVKVFLHLAKDDENLSRQVYERL